MTAIALLVLRTGELKIKKYGNPILWGVGGGGGGVSGNFFKI